MLEIILKISRILIVATTLVAVVAAPTLQAFSFAEQFTQDNKSCSCVCCESELEESTCPVKSEMSQSGCPCTVKQQQPFNSKPIESSVPNSQIKDGYDQISERFELIAAVTVGSFDQVPFKVPLSSHPPLYILNTSFLI